MDTGLRRTQRLQRQGAIPPPSASDPATTNSHIHIVGANWVDRFLNRNSGFKKVYIRYQESARKAATNDAELQMDFLRKLANLVRRNHITHGNICNCDEIGMTMGKDSKRTMPIVCVGGRSTASPEGSSEICNGLDTVSAAVIVIPPCIVWRGKTHRQTYSRQRGVEHGVTFAVFRSGYMDDQIVLEYIKHYFEYYASGSSAIHAHAENSISPPQCLIVDGHPSHVAWRVVKYALDHKIHMIFLPS